MKTTDFKGQASRVKKSMFVLALPAYCLILIGDQGLAGATAYGIFAFFL
ncbi:hypothetical protein [Candidatus Electrothrix sp.]